MSNWPPTGTPSSGLPAYCDIRNPGASKTACITGGGSAYPNNLCNVINPNTNADQCNASLKTSEATQNWAASHLGIVIPLAIIGIVLVMLIAFGFARATTTSSYGGSRKIFGISKILKKFF